MLEGRRRHPRAGGLAGTVHRPAADAGLAGGHASCSRTRTTRSPSATGSPPRCSPPGGFRSAASASSTATRISAITRSSTMPRATPARHQSARLRLHPHLPAELRRRRGRSLSRPAAAATTTWWCTPTRPGASSGSTRELIDALNIWARFIYGPLLDDRVRTIADGVKPSEYGRSEAFRVHQALKAQRPGDGAARIRLHGPRRHRPRRGVPASGARSSISIACSTRRSRILGREVAARQAAALARSGSSRPRLLARSRPDRATGRMIWASSPTLRPFRRVASRCPARPIALTRLRFPPHLRSLETSSHGRPRHRRIRDRRPATTIRRTRRATSASSISPSSASST